MIRGWEERKELKTELIMILADLLDDTAEESCSSCHKQVLFFGKSVMDG